MQFSLTRSDSLIMLTAFAGLQGATHAVGHHGGVNDLQQAVNATLAANEASSKRMKALETKERQKKRAEDNTRRRELRARKKAEQEERQRLEAQLDELGEMDDMGQGDLRSIVHQQQSTDLSASTSLESPADHTSTLARGVTGPTKSGPEQEPRTSPAAATKEKSCREKKTSASKPKPKNRKLASDSAKKGLSINQVWNTRRMTVDEELAGYVSIAFA